MRFKITVLFLLFASFSCIGQEVNPTKMEEKMSTVPTEPFGLIKQRKPVGDFMPDFREGIDFLIAKIGDEQYTIKPADLVSLIKDISWMSSIPRWNAYISYYKNGQVVYTNAQYVLSIDPKNPDPKIFKKIKYHKEIIEDEEKYVAKRAKLEKVNKRKGAAKKNYFIQNAANTYGEPIKDKQKNIAYILEWFDY